MDKNISRLHSFITDVKPIPTGHEFNRKVWMQLNRLRTGTGRFGSLMMKWKLTTTAAGDCGTKRKLLTLSSIRPTV